MQEALSFLQELKSFWREKSITAIVEMTDVRFSKAFWSGLDKTMHLSAEAAAGLRVLMTCSNASPAFD